jgi:hypothetical protein
MNLEHEFQLAAIKAQAAACQDLEAMRTLLLQAVGLMELQRQWLKEQVATGWLRKP